MIFFQQREDNQMKKLSMVLVIMLTLGAFSFVSGADERKIENTFYEERGTLNRELTEMIYEDDYYLQKRIKFNQVTESLRTKYLKHIDDYIARNQYDGESPEWVKEKKEIHYFFDKLKVQYSIYHEQFTWEKTPLDKSLEKNRKDFSNPEILEVEGFGDYIKAWLYYLSREEQKKEQYDNLDNRQLRATLTVIDENFENQTVNETLKYQYIMEYMDDNGVKNIGDIIDVYMETSTIEKYRERVANLYESEIEEREEHHMEPYKYAGPYELDIHMFLPDDMPEGDKRPVIIYFHGGSWSEGKPDWDFGACDYYAKQGWVAAAVEYRIADRHGSLPIESVMDAKSAVRWIRRNAEAFNIDPDKIVVAGNSAGGHLAMMTAMDDTWNEIGEDTSVSAVPNAVMVTSGVFDLTDEGTWIRRGLHERGLDDDLVMTISPLYHVRDKLPPMLVIHATEDRNVPYEDSVKFAEKMKKAGNEVEFHSIEGAGHFIWYGRYGGKVWAIRDEFIKSLGY